MKYNIENIQTQEIIMKFLKGELEKEDRKDFLAALAMDKVLAKEVAINEAILLNKERPDLVKMKSVVAGIAKSTLLTPNMEVDISEFESSAPSDSPETSKGTPGTDIASPKPTSSIGKWIIGSLFLGIGILSLLWFTMPDLFYFNKESLIVAAAKEMVPLEDVFVLPIEDDSPLLQAMDAYKQNNYQTAIQQFDVHLRQRPKDEVVQLFKAVAHLFQGELDTSIAQLDRLNKSDDSFLVKHSSWYLALAYIKNKQPSKAKQALGQLKEDTLYGQQAQELLKQL